MLIWKAVGEEQDACNIKLGDSFSAWGLVCYCEGVCPNHELFNGTCHAKPDAFCFSSIELVYDSDTDQWKEERSFGCLGSEELGLMQVQTFMVLCFHCCLIIFWLYIAITIFDAVIPNGERSGSIFCSNQQLLYCIIRDLVCSYWYMALKLEPLQLQFYYHYFLILISPFHPSSLHKV